MSGIVSGKDSGKPLYIICRFRHTQIAFGGLAQRESACLTSKMSQVQSLYPPSFGWLLQDNQLFLSLRPSCSAILSHMKRMAFVFILTLFSIVPLFSSYTVILPEKGYPHYALITSDGEMTDLDDTVWSKRWNGLRLEQLADGIYMVGEDGSAAVVTETGSDPDDLAQAIRFSPETITLLISAAGLPDDEVLENAGIRSILLTHPLPSREKARLSARGFEISQVRPGEAVCIENGKAVIEDSHAITVVCPDCGNAFTLYM